MKFCVFRLWCSSVGEKEIFTQARLVPGSCTVEYKMPDMSHVYEHQCCSAWPKPVLQYLWENDGNKKISENKVPLKLNVTLFGQYGSWSTWNKPARGAFYLKTTWLNYTYLELLNVFMKENPVSTVHTSTTKNDGKNTIWNLLLFKLRGSS